MSKFPIASCGTKRTRLLLLIAGLAALFSISQSLQAQNREQNSSDRKVITRVEPDYPETLKRLYIGGVVKVEAVVAPSGVVESTQLIGGSPILGQSAMKAVKQWKYAPAGNKEKIVVQLEFDPHR